MSEEHKGYYLLFAPASQISEWADIRIDKYYSIQMFQTYIFKNSLIIREFFFDFLVKTDCSIYKLTKDK